MFISDIRKIKTRDYNSTVKDGQKLKNGKWVKNEFTIKPIKQMVWENDPDVHRKGRYVEQEVNFQKEIDNAYLKILTLANAIKGGKLDPVSSHEHTDMSEVQKMDKTQFIDKIKETKKVINDKTKEMISKNMSDNNKPINTRTTVPNQGSQEQQTKENTQSGTNGMTADRTTKGGENK